MSEGLHCHPSLQTRKELLAENTRLRAQAERDQERHEKLRAEYGKTLGEAMNLEGEMKRLQGILEPLDRLRAAEGASVTVFCPNPDQGAEPGTEQAIEVCDEWTGWKMLRFAGETVAEALAAAETAHAAKETP